jgi:electron transfer flavoprotein alpha subunit
VSAVLVHIDLDSATPRGAARPGQAGRFDLDSATPRVAARPGQAGRFDLDGAGPHPASLAALRAGRDVASSWGATLYAAVIAPERDRLGAIETALARVGADKIVVAVADPKAAGLWAEVGAAWTAVLDQLRPRVVLFGADAPSAPELAARTGARIGAHLLTRARAIGIDDVELRDRDGGYARASDGGATVALIGRADRGEPGDDDVDVVVLVPDGGGDERIELAGTAAAELAQASALVAIGDDVCADVEVAAHAKKLAQLLGAQLVGGPAAVRAGLVAPGAVIERHTPLAPELCVAIGASQLDVAGASVFVRIGAPGGKSVDGALPGRAAKELAELIERLEGLA